MEAWNALNSTPGLTEGFCSFVEVSQEHELVAQDGEVD